jgi:SAM-dependent methyltransferase
MSAEAITPDRTHAHCRSCDSTELTIFLSLGNLPLSDGLLEPRQLVDNEPRYPLDVAFCANCSLVQILETVPPEELFGADYPYFSSFTDTLLRHSEANVKERIAERKLGANSLVVELASNDGYLLQYFVERGVPVLGVEPAANVAEVAEEKGIPTVVRFFGRETARELAERTRPNLLLGNNVLAHVPDLNDFVGGMKVLLADDGVLTMEFPHLWHLIEDNEFDTIYHEHFSYFSFTTVTKVFAAHGLTLFDVEELPTHGGSLRIFGRHDEDDAKPVTDRAKALLKREHDAGYEQIETYLGFAEKVKQAKWELLDFLIARKREGRRIVAYGAPAKGNTLLNYCGIRTDMIDFATDLNPHKQGRYLPGTRIPVKAPEAIREARPDYVLILPWNLKDEIVEQLSFIREWDGKFLVRVPRLTVIP